MEIDYSTGMENEQDEYLFEVISLRDDIDYKEAADKAFQELWKRHYNPMFFIAKNLTNGDEKNANDLVQETFHKILTGGSKSYTRKKIKNPADMIYATQKWMYSIMMHILIDSVSTNKNESEYEGSDYILESATKLKKTFNRLEEDSWDDNDDSDELSVIELGDGIISENLNEVVKYLDSLDEIHAHIVRFTYIFYEEGKNTPSEILDLLEITTGKSRENIRQILSRVRRDIKEKLKAKIKLRI